MSAIGLRPFLPADAPRCLAIFVAAIDELAGDDYDEDQREAWKASADDAAAFAKRLAASLTLVATLNGENVGFASLKGADVIDMLYVDPASARRGVASTLIEALTRLAQARAAERLTSDVSDTGKPLFERLGFSAQRRNLVTVGDQWLANTTMSKTLAKTAPPASPTTRH